MVGGGTAGHVIPALPVMQQLLTQDCRLTFVGTHSGLEQRLVADLPVAFVGIQAGKLRRYWSWQNLTDVARILVGVLQALWLLLRDRPQVVFSKGGFVSFPVAFAAWLLRIPVVAHESDLSPGLANRLVLPFVRCLCTSFAATTVARKAVKVVHVGTPIRPELLQGDAAAGRQSLQVPTTTRLLVVTGGSLGADHLNAVVRQSLAELTQSYFVFHVCGAGKLSGLQQANYQEVEYVGQGWGDILAAADIVLSRAGANALFELLALGKRNLLVPLSAKASRGDQIENAQFAQDQGYSVVIDEDEFDTASLLVGLRELEDKAEEFSATLSHFEVPPAAAKLTQEILQAAI